MPTTDEEWAEARSWIGPNEDQGTFDERVDRLGSVDQSIIESLRQQLADMTFGQPAGLGLPDGTNLQYQENIRAARESLQRFLTEGGTEEDETDIGGANVTTLSRPQYR